MLFRSHFPYPPQGWWQYPSMPPHLPQSPWSHPRPAPSPYQVIPYQKSALRLTGQRERMLWNPDCRLPWRLHRHTGNGICWDRHVPTRIQLNPGKAYVVQYTLKVCAISPAEGTGSILLRQSPCGAFADTQPLCLALGYLTHGPQTLHHVSVLHPCANSGCGVELSLVLNAKTPLCVERAEMDIVEL